MLREYVLDDWKRVHLYASNPEFSQFDVWGPNTVDDSRSYVADCIAKTAMRPVLDYELAVILRDQELLIGGCGIKRGSVTNNIASVGFAINPDFQRNGYATEVAIALIDFGFMSMGLEAIFAKCDTRNVASYRVMENAGMVRTARLKNEREVKGAMTDSYRYEISRK